MICGELTEAKLPHTSCCYKSPPPHTPNPPPFLLHPPPLHPSESLLMKTLAQRFCPALTARWKIRGEKCPQNERKARDKKQNLKARYISSFRCWQSATKSEVNEAWKNWRHCYQYLFHQLHCHQRHHHLHIIIIIIIIVI